MYIGVQSTGPESGPGEIDASDVEDELLVASIEGTVEVPDGVRPVGSDLDEGEHEVIRVVEAREDLVAADCDRGGALDAALDLDELDVGCGIAVRLAGPDVEARVVPLLCVQVDGVPAEPILGIENG